MSEIESRSEAHSKGRREDKEEAKRLRQTCENINFMHICEMHQRKAKSLNMSMVGIGSGRNIKMREKRAAQVFKECSQKSSIIMLARSHIHRAHPEESLVQLQFASFMLFEHVQNDGESENVISSFSVFAALDVAQKKSAAKPFAYVYERADYSPSA